MKNMVEYDTRWPPKEHSIHATARTKSDLWLKIYWHLKMCKHIPKPIPGRHFASGIPIHMHIYSHVKKERKISINSLYAYLTSYSPNQHQRFIYFLSPAKIIIWLNKQDMLILRVHAVGENQVAIIISTAKKKIPN